MNKEATIFKEVAIKIIRNKIFIKNK